ncbi:hypothetical protein NDU88_001881 [Pleurodeles waltl]|uniref:Secreted protein n=1 Tax=Pleurodeles waltl TaxID=8319 RepID=A0AAV7LYY0_PLEWA|nr:hypothetical protein NDU88_001881 [Pleurodeles waltl]
MPVAVFLLCCEEKAVPVDKRPVVQQEQLTGLERARQRRRLVSRDGCRCCFLPCPPFSPSHTSHADSTVY